MDTVNYLLFLLVAILCIFIVFADVDEIKSDQVFKIEGKISIPFAMESEWVPNTRVLVDGGKYLGFIRNDGSFQVSNIPSGSYDVEVANADYVFEPVRVDITSKGKIRARKLNLLQPSQVQLSTYPLKLKAKGKPSYFLQREQWRITDFLFNPMMLMMVVPFLLIMVLPKLVNTQDPETQKEMQNFNILNPRQNVPDMSEMLTSWFGGGSSSQKKAVKAKVQRKT